MAASKSVQKLISKVLLDGLYDQDSVLSQLRGCQNVMGNIWEELLQHWARSIRLPEKDIKASAQFHPQVCDEDRVQPFYLTSICPQMAGYEFPVRDPRWKLININMMPFIVGETLEECKLPEFVRPYWSLIRACLSPEIDRSRWHLWPREIPSEKGKVNYLTIQEGWVTKGTSQRRAGLHVDCPGRVNIKSLPKEAENIKREGVDTKQGEDGFCEEGGGDSQPFDYHGWGLGCCHYITHINEENTFRYPRYTESSYVLQGGIYIASNVAHSTRVWDCRVHTSEVGRLGNVEHLQDFLPEQGIDLKPKRLYWLTDRTPHESLPLKKGAFRQFFRLVTSQVGLWFADHSTPNPLGVKPDPDITKIVVGNKFSEEGIEIV